MIGGSAIATHAIGLPGDEFPPDGPGAPWIVPTKPGLEYTLPLRRVHYALPDRRLHYTLVADDA